MEVSALGQVELAEDSPGAKVESAFRLGEGRQLFTQAIWLYLFFRL